MNVNVCDRCGKKINRIEEANERDEEWRYGIVRECYPYPTRLEVDLCLNCKKDLAKWLKEKGGAFSDE